MSQTLSASTLLAVPLAPLAGSALAGLFGTAFGGNWIGRRLAHTLTILGVFVAFVLSALTLYSVAVHGARFNVRDGRALCAPAYTPTSKFPVKRENGGIWARDDRD